MCRPSSSHTTSFAHIPKFQTTASPTVGGRANAAGSSKVSSTRVSHPVHLEIQGALFGSGVDIAGIPVKLTFQHYWPKSNGGEASILELGKSHLHSISSSNGLWTLV
jgi:hypothetical protein